MTTYSRRARRILTVTALCCATAIAACSKKEDRVYFNGIYYPSKETADKADRKLFKVAVRRVEKGIDGAREAGRYGGTRYCLKNFGTSEIDWIQGPDGDDGTLSVEGGRLVLTGRCVLW